MPIKLQYFDARGVSETIRLMLAVAKVEYEDARYPFTFGTPGDFSTISRPEFDAAKAAGELTASAGKVPYLEVDGVKVGQSKAIERYVAKTYGLGGASDMEFAQIDAVCEQIRDIKDAYNTAKRGKDKGSPELEEALAKFFGETLPANVQCIEGMVPGGDFLFGKSVSYADIALWQFLAASDGGFFDNTEGAKASFAACPKITTAMAAVSAIPELQAWLEKRPKNMF